MEGQNGRERGGGSNQFHALYKSKLWNMVVQMSTEWLRGGQGVSTLHTRPHQLQKSA